MTRRRIASLLVAFAFVVFLVLHRHDIGTTTRALRHAEVGWIALGALLSTVLMFLYIVTRRAALIAVGVHLPLVSLARAVEQSASNLTVGTPETHELAPKGQGDGV